MQSQLQVVDIFAHYLAKVEAAISPGRLDRYMAAAGHDRRMALKLYVWNASICEAFYTPLKFCEITSRNAILAALRSRYGSAWYTDSRFRGELDSYHKDQLSRAINDESRQHGAEITDAHVISGVSFGFLCHLTTRGFHHLLWRDGIQAVFPCAPAGTPPHKLHDKMDAIRQWRNRVAHHKAIFDRKPIKKMNQALDLIGWVCPDTRMFVTQISRVTNVVAARPSN